MIMGSYLSMFPGEYEGLLIQPFWILNIPVDLIRSRTNPVARSIWYNVLGLLKKHQEITACIRDYDCVTKNWQDVTGIHRYLQDTYIPLVRNGPGKGKYRTISPVSLNCITKNTLPVTGRALFPA